MISKKINKKSIFRIVALLAYFYAAILPVSLKADTLNPSEQISAGGLSLLLAPALSAHGLISLGGSAASNLAELTLDSIDNIEQAVRCPGCNRRNAPNVSVGNRTIPLVVRENDYIEMNKPSDSRNF